MLADHFIDASAMAPFIALLAAVGTLMTVFLNHCDKRDERHEAELEAQREAFLSSLRDQEKRQEVFLGNHMSTITKSLEDVADTLKDLKFSVDHPEN